MKQNVYTYDQIYSMTWAFKFQTWVCVCPCVCWAHKTALGIILHMLLLWDRLSRWAGIHYLGKSDWPLSFRNLAAHLLSTGITSNGHYTCLFFFLFKTWVLGIKLPSTLLTEVSPQFSEFVFFFFYQIGSEFK